MCPQYAAGRSGIGYSRHPISAGSNREFADSRANNTMASMAASEQAATNTGRAELRQWWPVIQRMLGVWRQRRSIRGARCVRGRIVTGELRLMNGSSFTDVGPPRFQAVSARKQQFGGLQRRPPTVIGPATPATSRSARPGLVKRRRSGRTTPFPTDISLEKKFAHCGSRRYDSPRPSSSPRCGRGEVVGKGE